MDRELGQGGVVLGPLVLFAASAGALALVARSGFGEADRPLQGPFVASFYAACAAVMTLSVVLVRRARRGSSAGAGGALALGLMLGVGLWWLRNQASDQSLYDRTVAVNDTEAYRAYAAVGRLHRGEASRRVFEADELTKLRADSERFREHEHRVALAADAEAERAACEPVVVAGADSQQAIACYLRRATKARPEVAAWLVRRIRDGAPMKVGFRHGKTPTLDAHLEGREERTFEVLRQILAEVVPATVMSVERSTPDEADLRVSAVVAPGSNARSTVYAFDVALVPTAVTFRLTLPAAKKRPELRPRSLYELSEASAHETVGREDELMSARAYDRLYDELYGLFFDGDPRVPLRPVARGEGSARPY